MKKLIWINKKNYPHDLLLERIQFVKKNMNGLFPIYGQELKNIKKYASDNNIPLFEILSMRNSIKIQFEIFGSRNTQLNIDSFKSKFKKIVTMINLNQHDIKKLIKNSNLPVSFVIKMMKHMQEFNNLSQKNKTYLDRIQQLSCDYDKISKQRSREYEIMLENFLTNKKIHYLTETNIKQQTIYNVTPDILLKDPIEICVDGQNYIINWMDAKNYILIDVPFIINSLKKQANKYNKVFGLGAFVFHYGFDVTVKISGAILLDGSNFDNVKIVKN